MKVALVHDYLVEYGGAERVLEELHSIFPEAPIYAAFLDLKGLGEFGSRVKEWNVKTSWLQSLPFGRKLISPFRIFAPKIFEGFDLKAYDVVISSCAVYFSKAVITRPGALHISYIHTPPRYLYGYTTSFNYKKHWWTRIIGETMNHFLRIFDFQTSQRPDILVANSKNIAERIKKFYRREAVVIYPPVEIGNFTIRHPRLDRGSINNADLMDSRLRGNDREKKYFLSLSRLVRGKGVDVIVRACTELGVPLKVVGRGPELENLKRIAGKKVQFLGQVKDEEIGVLYANAKALIVASEDEDFGITAVEAQAAGTPVIAVKKGGYLESVIEGKTGVFFVGDSVQRTGDSLVEVLKNFDEKKFKREDLIKNAERFSKDRFKKEILELINKSHHSVKIR